MGHRFSLVGVCVVGIPLLLWTITWKAAVPLVVDLPTQQTHVRSVPVNLF